MASLRSFSHKYCEYISSIMSEQGIMRAQEMSLSLTLTAYT